MGGSGGTFDGHGRSPQEIAGKLRKQAEESAVQFEVDLAQEFNRLLSRFNARNTAETGERLEQIKGVLQDGLEATVDTLFGGSVAKHTYVDGISDVDSLLIVSGRLSDVTPQTVLKKVANALEGQVQDATDIGVGRVAITVTYADGVEIQLIPAVREGQILRVPAWESNRWSLIDPEQFRAGLTKRNTECANKLIPTLKLVKAVNATLPEAARLSGYHIESLGVAAFRAYTGEKTTVRMLPYFFERASTLVLRPMTDRTGQSVHVDEYLGEANSEKRVAVSHTLARIHQRMLNASSARSRERWRDLLGE